MPESAQREENAASSRSNSNGNSMKGPEKPFPTSANGDMPSGNRALAEKELDSALQLLVERAQYITGATGTALALPQNEEMVCRASAGSSAPAIGARLQVQSGLTGESITRRQLLRCDNAENDPRVNLETCRALGIASIVVLPLLRRNGEVRGLFELFSDHPYAFEERDLIALERMAELTITALDLAEQRQTRERPFAGAEKQVDSIAAVDAASSPGPVRPEVEIAAKTSSDIAKSAPALPSQPTAQPLDAAPVPPSFVQNRVIEAQNVTAPEIPAVSSSLPETLPSEISQPEAAPVSDQAGHPQVVLPEVVLPQAVLPEAMLRIQKCASCGFPVSEGRKLCLDCENSGTSKNDHVDKKELKSTQTSNSQADSQAEIVALVEPPAKTESREGFTDANASPESSEQFVPAFLANAVPVKESWLSNHVNLLAIAVVIMGILVAVVVFR
jgi:putative methionine-R-sulfoxide reductase with GAF domain